MDEKVSNQLLSLKQSMMLGEESAESEATLECLEEAAADGKDRILVLSFVDGAGNQQPV